MTAYGTIADAVTTMKDGGIDYLTKPFDLDVLVAAVARVETQVRSPGARAAGDKPPTLAEAMEEYEKEIIMKTVRGAGERRQRAAKLLGISRKSLWKKLTKYGLQARRHQTQTEQA
jgi:DNA-binding NtrC family response regulator